MPKRTDIRKILFAAAAVAAVAFVSAHARQSRNPGETTPPTDPKVQALVARRNALNPYIGSYPPRFADTAEANEVSKKITGVLTGLTALSDQTPDNARLHYELGVAYAMGDNAGLTGAWADAEKNFKQAIAIEPNRPEGHEELGRLYVNARPPLAEKAEEEFNTALRFAGSRPSSAIYNGLLFANFYQGKIDQAIAAGETSLKMEPENRQFRKALDMVKTKRDAGEKKETK